MKIIFNEQEAQETLDLVNHKVAACFNQKPKEVRFVFLSYIHSKKSGYETVGMCVTETNEIQICLMLGWQNTVVHELVHLYNPDMTETKVRIITNDVIKYLKGLVR